MGTCLGGGYGDSFLFKTLALIGFEPLVGKPSNLRCFALTGQPQRKTYGEELITDTDQLANVVFIKNAL